MIKQILDLLNMTDWHGVSENIDIAKGKYKAVKTINELKKSIKREYHGGRSIN